MIGTDLPNLTGLPTWMCQHNYPNGQPRCWWCFSAIRSDSWLVSCLMAATHAVGSCCVKQLDHLARERRVLKYHMHPSNHGFNAFRKLRSPNESDQWSQCLSRNWSFTRHVDYYFIRIYFDLRPMNWTGSVHQLGHWHGEKTKVRFILVAARGRQWANDLAPAQKSKGIKICPDLLMFDARLFISLKSMDEGRKCFAGIQDI